jgi:uncharacterized integral membrane protein
MVRSIAALLLFGISFGYLEAAVVVYLRAIYDPIRLHAHPGIAPGELFPLISPEQLAAAGPENTRRLGIEIGREAATILMLAAFGMVAGRNFHQRMAAFSVVFGLWDLFYYVFLKLTIDWPASLFTWDILFLIPLPWAGPVIAPSLISLALIGCGLYSFYRGGIAVNGSKWMIMIAGGLIVILSFVWDYRNTTSGGVPNPFHWPLFFAGLLLSLAGFIAAARNPEFRGSQTPRGS